MDQIQVLSCQVCFIEYDLAEHLPRSAPCGHTICSNCIKDMLQRKDIFACPLDRKVLPRSSSGLDAFPVNFSLREIVEQKLKDSHCRVHGKKLDCTCLTDQSLICELCVSDRAHRGHKT